jgi:FeoB-associated Cys-rich membrane protein
MQTIIVSIIIIAAVIYVGSLLLKKAKSFSPKKSCGSDCGCEAKSKIS